MNIKIILLLACYWLCANNSTGQIGLQWVERDITTPQAPTMGNNTATNKEKSSEQIRGMERDAQGNLYMVGTYDIAETVQIDNQNANRTNIGLFKYDKNGVLLWKTKITTTGSTSTRPNRVCGFSYPFCPGGCCYYITLGGSAPPNELNFQTAYDVAVTSTGVYVSMNIPETASSMQFHNPNGTVANTLILNASTSAGGSVTALKGGYVLVKYNLNGNFAWQNNTETTKKYSRITITDIEADDVGNVYVAGDLPASTAIAVRKSVSSTSIDLSPSIATVTTSGIFNSGSLNTGSPVWGRNSNGSTCGVLSGNYYHQVFRFRVNIAGNYIFNGCVPTGQDMHASLYRNSFNPSSPCTPASNFIIADDDGNASASGCGLASRIRASLVPNVDYYLVTTSYSQNSTFSYQWTYSGPSGSNLIDPITGTSLIGLISGAPAWDISNNVDPNYSEDNELYYRANSTHTGIHPFLTSYTPAGDFRWLTVMELKDLEFKFCNYSCATPNFSQTDIVSANASCPTYICASPIISSFNAPFTPSKGNSKAISFDGPNMYWGGNYQGRIKRVFTLTPGVSPNGNIAENQTNIESYSSSNNLSIDSDAFIFKSDRNTPQTISFIKTLNGLGEESVEDVKAHNGDVFFALNIASSRFNNRLPPPYDPTSVVLAGRTETTQTSDVFVGLLASDNTAAINRVWMHKLEPTGNLTDNSAVALNSSSILSIDDSDTSLCVSGTYFGRMDIWNSPSSSTLTLPSTQAAALVSNASNDKTNDIWFAKYNKVDGTRKWIKSIGGAGNEYSGSILSQEENVFIAGAFVGISDFEPSTMLAANLSSFGRFDAFVSKYGCNTGKITITEASLPLCEGTPVVLKALVDCQSGNCQHNYQWIDQNGNSISTLDSTLSLTGLTGSQIRKVVITDLNTGCVMKDSINFTIAPAISLSIAPTTALICDGNSVVFSTASASNNLSYKWYLDGALIPLANSASYNGFQRGAYQVEATNILTGCSVKAVASLNKYPSFYPYFAPDTGLLCGNATTLEVVNCPGCTYSWLLPAGSNAVPINNRIDADIQGTYISSIIDINGCIYQREAPVLLSSNLLPSILAKDAQNDIKTTVCDGSPLLIETPSCIGCSYLWSDGSTANFTFAFGAGTFAVSVTNNNTGCSGRSIDLLIDTLSVVSPIISSTPTSICNLLPANTLSAATLTVTNPSPNAVYYWYANSNLSTSIDTGFTTNVTANTDYLVQMYDTTKKCKSYSNVLPISTANYSNPLVNATSTVICGGAAPVLSTTACAGCSYQWYSKVGATSWLPMGGANTNQLTVPSTGKYQLYITYANGCEAISDSILIAPSSFVATISLSSTNVPFICNGNPVTLLADGVIQLPPLWDYQWIRNSTAIVGAVGNIYTTAQPGTYQLRITDDRGCTSLSNAITINTSNSTANPSIAASTETLCGGDTTRITASVTNCSACQFAFYDATGAPLRPLDTIPYYDLLATNSVRLIFAVVRDVTGCLDTSAFLQIRDTFLPTPTLISINNPICSPTGVILSTTAQPVTEYIWMSNGASYLTNQNTFRVDSLEGNYSVRIKQGNCFSQPSNQIPISFANFNAQLYVTGSSTICNGSSVQLSVSPVNPQINRLRATNPPITVENGSLANSGLTVSSASLGYTNANQIIGIFIDSIKHQKLEELTIQLVPPGGGAPISLMTGRGSGNGAIRNLVLTDAAPVSITTVTGSVVTGSFQPETPFSTLTGTMTGTGGWTLRVTDNALPDTGVVYSWGLIYRYNRYNYLWRINNNIVPNTLRDTAYAATAAGTYRVDVVDSITGCVSSTLDVPIQSATAGGTITASTTMKPPLSALNPDTAFICGTLGTTQMSVPPCAGCIYRWYRNGTLIPGANAANYTVTGVAARALYTAQIINGGCIAADTIFLETTPAFLDTINVTPGHANICAGTPIVLSGRPSAINRQWFLNNVAISGIVAQQTQYQTNVPGTYHLVSVNDKGCSATTNSITAIASNPPVGFGLVLDALNPIPNTTPPISLNNYLQPIAIRGGAGTYSSATASGAINNTTDVFTPSIAGAGLHIISYSHPVGACTFVASDTVEVLEAASVNVENRRLLFAYSATMPSYEACLRDSLRFLISNFPFSPNRIQFVTDTGLITVPVTSVVTANGAVFNGYSPVNVPSNARTGKVRLVNGTDTFQTTFFLVVQNPAVSMNLAGVSQPVCSNQGLIGLTAVPNSGATGIGRFAGAYLSNPTDTTVVPRLVAPGGTNLIVPNIRDYDVLNGVQNLRLYYVFTPYYTGTTFTCPSISTSLDVEARNVRLDSIEYTPIAITQGAESMFNLTRLVFPVSSRVFTGNYSGTYINSSNILPATISSGWGPQPVTYTINNGACSNSITDIVDVMSRPILDSIANYICRRPNDTVFIGRDLTSMYLGRRIISGGPIVPQQRFNHLYTYQFNTRSVLDTFDYFERINIMSLTSSNGGLLTINNTPGQELFALVPSNIPSNSTTLDLRFTYQKNVTFFDPVSASIPSSVVNYTIGGTQRTINFEDLQAVTINPAIVSNPVFCKENQIYQFSGSPNGGQYYLNRGAIRDTLVNNLFNPINYLTPNGINDFGLTYIYTGPACKDSASITIKIPNPFTITLTSPSAPNFCQEEANDTITILSNISSFPAPTNSLNLSSGVFFVGGVQSGQIFSPSLRGPGIYPVSYTIADSFGCTASDSDLFRVDSTPNIAMTPALPSFLCANAAAVPISLFANNANITGSFGTNTVTLTGRGIRNPLSASPDYYPLDAVAAQRDTTLRDTITYTLVGINGCRNTIEQYITIRELPQLALTVQGGAPVESSYCEGDSVRIVGIPLGGTFSDVNAPAGINGFNATNGQFNPLIQSNAIDTNQMYLYTYADINTTCRDTIRDTILIKNRAELFITGIVPNVCAKDTTIIIGQSLRPTSPNVTVTSGSFSLLNGNPMALREISTVSPLAHVYPDSAGLYDDSLRLRIRLNFSSNGCNSQVDTSFRINPLPQLSFNPPGDTLLSTANDTRFHICETADSVFMVARNRFRGAISPIVPDTVRTGGLGFNGRGIRFRSFANGFVYFPDSAGSGIDTITYRYRDIRGCENSTVGYTVIDTVPALGFAGFAPSKQTNQLIATEDSFAYCANDAGATIVPSPFGGFLYFQNALQNGGIYNFVPDDLDTTPARTYTLTYRYIAQRYANGGVCQDSLKTYVTVRPTPVLNFVSVPNRICVDTNTVPFPLSATPLGGFFQDVTGRITNTAHVAGGILADTLFDPLAQQGNRYVAYRYTDPLTTCADTIEQLISIFRTPEVSFATGGGCQGDLINFQIGANQLSIQAPSYDSITMYAWDFGDAIVDTVRPNSSANRIVVPNRNHTYAAGGVYFPMLTVVNQNQCVDSFRLRIAVSSKVTVTHDVPYTQDFEASPAEWIQETKVRGSLDSLWDWGIATGSRITTDQVQNHVWVTHADDPYEVGERGWVYSPCFDISDLSRPMIALDIWNDTRAGVDGAAIEYFHPNRGWVLLGERDKGRNWYDSLYLIGAPGIQIDSPQYAPLGWSGENLDGFKRAAYRLDTDRRNGDLRGMRNVRFRVAFAASDNTVVNGREGFAFDNVYVGDRRSSVLVEHFSNQNILGIATLENNLYSSLFNNLYGRDVVYMQYQTNLEGVDLYNTQAASEANARMLYYGVSGSSKKVRINGQDFVDLTEDLLRNMNNEREYLDMEMLREDTFDITIPVIPQIFQAPTNSPTGTAAVTVTVASTRNLPLDKYIVHAVITEDSLRSTQRHNMMGVVRNMQPNASGTEFEQTFAPGDAVTIPVNWTFPTATYKKNNLRLVVFVQNQATAQVYQVATSRDLSIFEGPVNVEELTAAEGKEILDLKLFPNPTTDNFTVAFDKALEGEYEWRVTNALGQVLTTGQAQAGTQQLNINTHEFAAGMYIFSINNEKVYTQRQVIVVRP